MKVEGTFELAIAAWDIVRASVMDALLVVGITALITAAPLLPVPLSAAASVAVACITVLAWVRRCRAAASVGLFCVVWLALVLVGIRYSQITLGAGLVAHAWATRRVAWLQGTGAWMRRGSLGLDVWPLVVGMKGTHDHIDGSHHHFAHPTRTWITSESGCSSACGI
jgi:hypothetical protein